MSEPITYAKVDGPPRDWMFCWVYDHSAGAEVTDVVEVNAAEGWLIKLVRGEGGQPVLDGPDGDILRFERVDGHFEIRRRA